VTLLAIGTAAAVLAWIGLALGLAVAILVAGLFNRVVRPALEIRRYADDILAAGLAIAHNLDGVDELAHTRRLAGKVPSLVGGYIERIGAGR
jgi:hypothetical protein